MSRAAVVLLSGGLDSAVTLAAARRDGFTTHALTFDYGQRHAAEIACARRVADALGAARHIVLPLPLREWGGSSLTSDAEVLKNRDAAEIAAAGIPDTYVPARNTVFLSLALAWAETLGANYIYIGVNAVDYSGYPDCRPEYIEAFEKMARLATRAGVSDGAQIKIMTPLSNMSKAEIIKLGMELGVDFKLTHSCYDPGTDGRPCGCCDSCVLRAKGFREAGASDPALG